MLCRNVLYRERLARCASYATESSWLGVRRMLRSMSCCVGMCCIESGWLGVHRMLQRAGWLGVRRMLPHYVAYDAHRATAPQHIPTQHDMLLQHLVCKNELNCEYCNITLARNNKGP